MSNRWCFDEVRSLDLITPLPDPDAGCRSPCFEDSSCSSTQAESLSRAGFQNSTRSSSILVESLRDLGLDEISPDIIDSCGSSVHGILWKLLAMVQQNSRQLSANREASARIENENKLIKVKNSRCQEEITKLRSELAACQLELDNRDARHKERLEEANRSRFEWEKAALDYKNREKRFMAELRRKESDFGRYQERVRRSVSVVNSRQSSCDTLVFNESGLPPPLTSLRW